MELRRRLCWSSCGRRDVGSRLPRVAECFQRSATHFSRASCAHGVVRLCQALVFAGDACFGGGLVNALARVREAVGLGASLPMVLASLLVGCWTDEAAGAWPGFDSGPEVTRR
jgi:hypothetical protein